MHESRIVRGGQRAGDLRGVLDGGAQREARRSDDAAQRQARDPLHDDEVDVAIAAGFVHRHDVRMIERRRSLGLTDEPLAVVPIRLIGEDHLDGHRAAEPIVGGLVHRSHRAGAQLRRDDVVAERTPWRQQQQRSCARLVERHESVNHGRRSNQRTTKRRHGDERDRSPSRMVAALHLPLVPPVWNMVSVGSTDPCLTHVRNDGTTISNW